MASGSSSRPPQIDLDALIQSLPACRRCRECRRGCDTLLPKCGQCTKANVDCLFMDHGRGELLPRSRIAELVDHVRRLSPAGAQPSPAAVATPSTIASSSTVPAESVSSEAPHHEHYFAQAGGSFRYLGANSCLVKSPRLQQAEIRTPIIQDDNDWELVWKGSSKTFDLVQTYLDVVQPLYPILDPKVRFLAPDLPPDLDPAELFCLNMVCSISCFMQPARNRKGNPDYQWRRSGKLDFHHFASEKFRCLAQTYFKQAMEHLDATTVDPTLITLQAVLLLAIHSLFDPKNGNIGQQIALASRLALRMEVQDLPRQDVELVHDMHSTIFSIENEIAATLDRPAYFPEPSWDLYFRDDRPHDFLCSLYRLQHRFRKGDLSVKALLPPFDNRSQLHPGLRMALHQTHLLLNPCWGSAFYVLEAVVSQDCIHMFLTSHWVYRAGCILIENIDHVLEQNFIQLYSNALVVLELSSGRYPNTGVLKDSLVDLMQRMKTKYRPQWETEGLQLYDVRL